MTSGPVWLDGELVPASEARISVFDHGLTVGDGVFETLKVLDRRPFALRRHLARLHRSAGRQGLIVPVTDARLRAAVDDVLGAAEADVGRLRITLTGGAGPLGSWRGGERPTLIVSAAPQPAYEPDTTAITVPWPRNDRSPLAGVKATSYAENVVILAEARKAGATEAILPNTLDHLCEGTGTNVFVQVGGRLLTPSLMSGCLAGVTRELLLEELDEADEEDLPLSVLDRADEVLLTSSTREVQPLRALDGRPLPGVDGPVAQRARAAWAALRSRTLDP